MSRNIGFVFLFSEQLPLKPYSEENKLKYQSKILLHKITFISHVCEYKNEYVRVSLINTITDKGSILKIIQTEFKLKSNYIIDYNPIPKKLLKRLINL